MVRPALKVADAPPGEDDATLVAIDRFVLATRDSGYKGTTSAISELVDNSIQANASLIEITVQDDGSDGLAVAVLDNGTGMDRKSLRHALRFGGSSRFNDRTGMGRFGMGLPNASLSQARRVEVFSWQRRGTPLMTYLDIDEIVAGTLTHVPAPASAPLPDWAEKRIGPNGTLVLWTNCDRLDNRRVSTVTKKVAAFLGRVFRHHIWTGVDIQINGDPVRGIDPLFLHKEGLWKGGTLYGEVLKYEVEAHDGATGNVTVAFSELPVDEWHSLSNEEKRARGVSDGAGVSFVRAGREIELAWLMLGGKRRENYDDWWRCEVQFSPSLDEVFGITHTKQQVRPDSERLQAVIEDMAQIARTLNARARKAHLEIKTKTHFTASEERAASRDKLLEPLPRAARAEDANVKELVEHHRALKNLGVPEEGTVDYKVVPAKLPDTTFFAFTLDKGRLVVVVNPSHPFYRRVYLPLVEAESPVARAAARHLELVLIAAARTEALATKKTDREVLKRFRNGWSHAMATFLKD